MGSQIAVPLWAVIIVALLAALAVIDRILMPSVRWALRHRANRLAPRLDYCAVFGQGKKGDKMIKSYNFKHRFTLYC